MMSWAVLPIRIHRIHIFLGILDPEHFGDNIKKKLWFLQFCDIIFDFLSVKNDDNAPLLSK